MLSSRPGDLVGLLCIGGQGSSSGFCAAQCREGGREAVQEAAAAADASNDGGDERQEGKPLAASREPMVA